MVQLFGAVAIKVVDDVAHEHVVGLDHFLQLRSLNLVKAAKPKYEFIWGYLHLCRAVLTHRQGRHLPRAPDF